MGTISAIAKIENYAPADLDREAGQRWVTMSNAMNRASHGLTLVEKRILMSAIAQLDSARNPRPGECPVVQIKAADYAATFGLDPNISYEQLQTGAKHLYERSITFFESAYNRKGVPLLKGKVITMRWVGQADYKKNEGCIELHFWHAVVPHLMGLKKAFTSYQLQQASALRSVYSWRLLELLMRFKVTGWAEYEIDDFCMSMGATEKQKENFAAIRRKIIEPAVAELIAKDGWLIEWSAIKTGRKVTAVRFDFKRNQQGPLSF